MAREESDPGVAGALEPSLGFGRDGEGPVARNPGGGLEEEGLAAGERATTGGRLLRRVHGRGAHKPAGLHADQTDAGRDRSDQGHEWLAADDPALPGFGHLRAVRNDLHTGPAQSDADDR